MIFVGIDPGREGAVSVLTPTKAQVFPMPMLATGKGEREVYDVNRLASWLRPLAKTVADRPLSVLVMIEEPGPIMGMLGTIANYQRGAGPALFVGICAAFCLPRQTVRPQTWQAAMIAVPAPAKPRKRGEPKPVPPTDKEALKAFEKEKRDRSTARRNAIKAQSILAAQRLFPGVSLIARPGSIVLSDGMAEALLLAEYARRLHSGGVLFVDRSA